MNSFCSESINVMSLLLSIQSNDQLSMTLLHKEDGSIWLECHYKSHKSYNGDLFLLSKVEHFILTVLTFSRSIFSLRINDDSPAACTKHKYSSGNAKKYLYPKA